jgi:indolepyruvate ferredoxin oxidoreductase
MTELRQVSLEDKYLLKSDQIFVTGIQALVRLPMMQSDADRRAGLHTAGYVTGYRGSPLGALDQQLALARSQLEASSIKFLPAVNEDLAATAVWGTQQAGWRGDGLYDGVFSMWYAKGPGVDRSGDPLRHGNLAGTSANGGVLILMGDDHVCESSTTAHQSEYSLVNTFIPVLNPAGVQDILDFGLYGWALSRYSGCWIGLKSVHDTVEASASVIASPDRISTSVPHEFVMPEGGVNFRWPDTPQAQEARLHQFKLPAVSAFLRQNPIDRQVLGDALSQLGVISTGKSYLDVRRALLELGIDESRAKALGLKLYKVGMPWPLEPEGLRAFARGVRKLLVVEEKRALIEDQVRSILYGVANPPEVIGKVDESGAVLFQAHGRLDAAQIGQAIGERLLEFTGNEALAGALESFRHRADHSALKEAAMRRTPYFCAGCPHNTSTQVPDGSRALAGIGCHYMAQWMDRETATFTQMGGEGASWIGEAPFSATGHVFQNIGDGTYFHSGLLAIRACVGAQVNITYKILYNDAVAMTGGQSVDGPMDVMRISRQVHAEGVSEIAVITDDPDKYPSDADWAPGVRIYHRDLLARVQRQMREVLGTSVIIYDQTCAAEKRRRRRRGLMETPNERLFINEAVCEGCGDCGVQSNCVALIPVETDLGRKRAIDQSACNLDYSCNKGFCPSFVSVIGGEKKKPTQSAGPLSSKTGEALETVNTGIEEPYSIILTGVGGTGVVTIGAIVGMAAHIARMGCSVLDMAGLAQKGGAVTSHIILTPHPDEITATHIADGGSDLLLGCDVVSAAAQETRVKLSSQTTSIINTYRMMSGEFTHEPDQSFPLEDLVNDIRSAAGELHTVSATEAAKTAFGDTLTANIIMLGYAYQCEALPIPHQAVEKAIELNGRDIDTNIAAFRLGRSMAADPAAGDDLIGRSTNEPDGSQERSEGGLLKRRVDMLDESHGSKVAAQLSDWVAIAQKKIDHRYHEELIPALIESAFRVLYQKDEYEVARLYSQPKFRESLSEEFEGRFKLRVHLAPPLLSRRDSDTGRPVMRSFGPWVFTAFKVLSTLRWMRGKWFDPFRFSPEKELQKQIQSSFERTINRFSEVPVTRDNIDNALRLAKWPMQVRGFGPVRAEAFRNARGEIERLESALGVTSES